MRWPFERVRIVRHGQTEWNRSGRRQGLLDSPSTAEGTRHAEVVASVLTEVEIDGIFTSLLGRAYRTAAIIGAKLGQLVQTIDTLAELHHGTLAGLTNQDIEARHPGELQRREDEKYTWRFPGGESYADADVRASKALEQLVNAGVRFPLVVTHEMIGRMLRRTLLDLPPQDALTWSMPHGAVIEIVPDNSGRIAEDAGTSSPLTKNAD